MHKITIKPLTGEEAYFNMDTMEDFIGVTEVELLDLRANSLLVRQIDTEKLGTIILPMYSLDTSNVLSEVVKLDLEKAHVEPDVTVGTHGILYLEFQSYMKDVKLGIIEAQIDSKKTLVTLTDEIYTKEA